MKKIIAAATVLSVLTFNTALAETKGNYFGVNIINTTSEYTNYTSYEEETHSDTSFGVNYKYAFNFNKFFVAPGIFFDHNNTKVTQTNDSLFGYDIIESELHHSYGADLSLGYDVTDKFAIFGNIGHSENRVSSAFYSKTSSDSKMKSTYEAFIYGGGFKLGLSDELDLNATYLVSQYGISDDVLNTTDKFNSNYHTVKVGISYNF
jgi:opacity protein-like surface antigen